MSIKKKAKNIKLVLTDCDGVLTDAGMYYSSDGVELKKFTTRDGVAFAKLRNMGIKIGIITGENTPIVNNRANKLKMDYLVLGATNKLSDAQNIVKELGITLDEVLYFGDDENDIELLKNVGISACPKDANKKVKKICDYTCKTVGGSGVIREVIDRFF